MFIIGELINGMYPNIASAIESRDKHAIQDCALNQLKAGADALDINCGPASKNPHLDMAWLVDVIGDVTDKELCLDSSNPKVIQEGLKVSRNRTIINSTTADKEKLDILIPLAKKYKSKLIGIAISSKGIPQTKQQRLESAFQIVNYCLEHGFAIEDLYLDPVLPPVNIAQNSIKGILEVIGEFKMISDGNLKTVLGLSNISQGVKIHSLINRTFLSMAVAYGLDSAILNPCDKKLMDALITAEVILNKNIYCDSFLEAYRKK